MSRITEETSKSQITALENLLAIVLGLGMFPSFLALSESLTHSFPSLSRYMGPINFLKIFWPLMLVYIGLRWKNIPFRSRRWLPIILAIGTLATLIAAIGCHFPPMFLREWFVICVGIICSITLILLPQSKRKIVALFWVAIVLSGAAINMFAPEASNWLFAHVFDYNYRIPESRGAPLLLSGFYDVASMGKLLAWLPWTFGVLYFGSRPRLPQWISFLALLTICTVLIPITTQRGPLLGMALGWILATAHLVFQTGQKKLLKWIPAALLAVAFLTWAIVPKQILETRFLAYFGTGVTDQRAVHESRVSSDQRMRIWKLAVQHIRSHPLGCPCPSRTEYETAGIAEMSHAHNIFLEQFASRGWIWGSIHLLLWLSAFTAAWLDRSRRGSLLVGGIATTLGLGMVDHPWFVLNHAIILGMFLFYYWIRPTQQNEIDPIGQSMM